MRKIWIILIAICLFAPTYLNLYAHAGKGKLQEDTVIEVTKVDGNIYMLKGRGGNIGISVGTDGILMIDDQFANLSQKIMDAISKIDKGEIKFVVNTHYHGDHVGGNANFAKTAIILSHHNVRKRLAADKSDPAALPVITFEDGVSIHFNGEEVKVIHWAGGHTDGDAVIFFPKSNVVHTGDQMFSGMFPFVDLSGGGDVQKYMDNVAEILQKVPDDAKIIPGHGPLSTKDDLRKVHEMLVETTRFIRKKIDSGERLETIVAAGLPEKWKSWSWSFVPTEKWIKTVYKSYTR